MVNRAGFDPKPYNEATLNNLPQGHEDWPNTWTLHGPELSLVAAPGRIIRGVVKDIDTGKQRAGVKVYLDVLGLDGNHTLPAITDAEGRYEIRGAHKATRYSLDVLTDNVAGYLSCQVHVDDKPGNDHVNADIGVKRGVIVTGKLLDAVTMKPLVGRIWLGVLSDNPFAPKYPNPGNRMYADTGTTPDGVFRIVSIPGPVILMGGVSRQRFAYKPPIPDPKYPQYFTDEQPIFPSFHGAGAS